MDNFGLEKVEKIKVKVSDFIQKAYETGFDDGVIYMKEKMENNSMKVYEEHQQLQSLD